MHQAHYLKIIALIACLLAGNSLLAQRGGGFNSNPNSTSPYPQDTFPILDSLPFERVPDTVRITYIFANNPSQEYLFADTLLENFQQYEPTRRTKNPHATLGNLGSPTRPLVYELRDRRGFDTGFHQFDIYKSKPEDLRYFTLAPAYSNLDYSQGVDQNDSQVNAEFSRKFSGGMSMSLYYNRFLVSLEDDERPLNQNIFYKYQAARHTQTGIGLWYRGKKNRYDGFLSYHFNQNQHINHGGMIPNPLADSLLLAGNDSERTSILVFQNAETSNTKQDEQVLNFIQHYRFGGQLDSLGQPKRNFRLSHELNYENAKYKFSEEQPDSSYYGLLYTDERGLRQFVQVRAIENHFSINTFKNIGRNAKQQRDLLKVGLLHRYNNIEQEVRDSVVQNLFLTGQWNFKPNDRLKIETSAHLGLWNQAGDYQAKGKLFLDLKTLGQLEVIAKQQLYKPSLLQTRSYISERLIWNNDFRKTLETQLGGTWSRPEWQLRISANYFLVNNLVYFDSDYIAQQDARAFSIGQLSIQKNVQFWKIHLDNTLILQQNSANDILPLPTLTSINSLYYEGRIFKQKMLARFGFDFLYHTNYFAPSYQAAIGQFYIQDQRQAGNYPATDAFLSFKVDRFRAFFKIENISALATRQIYYQIPYYPQRELYFRFGVKWIFLDAALPPDKERRG